MAAVGGARPLVTHTQYGTGVSHAHHNAEPCTRANAGSCADDSSSGAKQAKYEKATKIDATASFPCTTYYFVVVVSLPRT